MTEINFEDRVREAFGEATPKKAFLLRGLSAARAQELDGHHRWVRSGGRFGYPVTWKSVSLAFEKADHAAEDFAKVTLINCAFSWSDLRCASFAGAHLKDVSFENCDLESCDFTDAHLENVTFTDCLDLDKAKFERATFIAKTDSPGLAEKPVSRTVLTPQ